MVMQVCETMPQVARMNMQIAALGVTSSHSQVTGRTTFPDPSDQVECLLLRLPKAARTVCSVLDRPVLSFFFAEGLRGRYGACRKVRWTSLRPPVEGRGESHMFVSFKGYRSAILSSSYVRRVQRLMPSRRLGERCVRWDFVVRATPICNPTFGLLGETSARLSRTCCSTVLSGGPGKLMSWPGRSVHLTGEARIRSQEIPRLRRPHIRWSAPQTEVSR